ncbi:hypothetical protein [Kosakonia cowanii]|uniref:hypothetical protein n=1 Tax=Kosakonia cowanii TaxID=208223 RepID=UPI00320B63BE
MKTQDGFEIIKNHDEDDASIQGSVLARWKGFSFYILFNDKLADNIKRNSEEDDELIYRAIAYDFAIAFAIKANDIGNESIPKYKIANHANFNTELGAVVIYREDADMFEIAVRHSVYLKERTPPQIVGVLMKMILTGSIAVQELKEMIKVYKDAPDVFLNECKSIVE